MDNSQKWLGEGAKGALAKGAKVSQESFAPPKPCLALVQNSPLHQCKRPLHRRDKSIHKVCFSALKNQVSQQTKNEVWCMPRRLFSSEKKEKHIHQLQEGDGAPEQGP